MNKTILEFISHQKTASFCCTDQDGLPYCFSCFYAFGEEEGILIFKSSAESHHGRLLANKIKMAGTILPDKLNLLAIKGIQLSGLLLNDGHPLSRQSSIHYYSKFPFATAIPGKLWTIQLTRVKMTDNTLGMGHKITWELNESLAV